MLQQEYIIKLKRHKGKKILVVDDNCTDLQLLRSQLLNWELRPTLAASGEQALEILSQNNSFHLVLTAMEMPRMDGLELATAIKQRIPAISLILLNAASGDPQKNNSPLFNSILLKPVRRQELFLHIMNALETNPPAPEG
jgi:two-component system sensor histidine kinase/response regulator